LCSVPFYALAYDEKVESFLKSAKIGYFAPVDEYDTDKIKSDIIDVITGRDEIKKSLTDTKEHLSKKANQNKNEAMALLDDATKESERPFEVEI